MSTINSYNDWNILGLILWLIILFLMFKTRNSWSQTNGAHLAVGMVVVSLSPTLWFVQNSVFVFLELGPIIGLLFGLILLEKANTTQSKVSILYSALWTGAAGLFHERFYLASLVLGLACYLRSRKYQVYKSGHLLYFVTPLIWFYSMTISLGADPLRGGGEVGLSNSFGPWILQNLNRAFIEMFWVGGETIYLGTNNVETIHYFGTAVLLVGLCVFSYLIQKNLGYRGLETWLLAFACAFPAGLVYERIELRWLLAPTVFLCLLAWMVLDLAKTRVVKALTLSLMVAVGVMTITVQTKFKESEKWRTDTQKIVNYAASNAPLAGEWHLSIELFDDSELWRQWALGNGAVFSENISNGPWTYMQYLEECPINCINLLVSEKDGELVIDRKK
jgi:hypothetical protein